VTRELHATWSDPVIKGRPAALMVENASVVDLQINHSPDCKIVRLLRGGSQCLTATSVTLHCVFPRFIAADLPALGDILLILFALFATGTWV
jgi:hypothetical protein